ncbi:MAG: hypothetical protein RMJ84_12920 [Sandaracinaceae bacterium]|nr:hypothetical protein [Sandaracinaceae bacterium]
MKPQLAGAFFVAFVVPRLAHAQGLVEHPAIEQRMASAPAVKEPEELDPEIPFYSSSNREEAAFRALSESQSQDRHLPVGFWCFVGVGVPLESSYAQRLETLGHGDGLPVYTLDMALSHAIFSWLHLGARFDARMRFWMRTERQLIGVQLFALLPALWFRFAFGGIFEIGGSVGGGGGAGNAWSQLMSTWAFVPRISANLHVGMRLAEGFRVFLRAGGDVAIWGGLDAAGSEVDVGGVSIAFGTEVRG